LNQFTSNKKYKEISTGELKAELLVVVLVVLSSSLLLLLLLIIIIIIHFLFQLGISI